jgi:FAD synthetase
MENTHPNPDLLDGNNGYYKPAFMLTDESHERHGRVGSSAK